MGTERNGGNTTADNAESTFGTDIYRQTVLRLGLPLVTIDKDRNIDNWQEVRAMEQVVYLASWVYMYVGVNIGRISYADVFRTTMPHMSRAQKSAFLDNVCSMVAHSVGEKAPASQIGIAALGGLIAIDPKSRHTIIFREILKSSPIAHAAALIPYFHPQQMGYANKEERRAIVQGFKYAYTREVHKDAEEFAEWKRHREIAGNISLVIGSGDSESMSVFNRHAIAFQRGTEHANRWILPTMPPHFFGRFLTRVDFDTLPEADLDTLLTEPQESEDF